MKSLNLNPKVIGATIVGGSLVLGALVLNNLQSGLQPEPAKVTVVRTLPTDIPDRTFIPVVDSNEDGVEDWQEEFVVQAQIELPASSTETDFTMPTTVTDQVGIQIFESLLRNKTNSQFTQSHEEIVTKTTSKINTLAKDTLYTTKDITVIPTDPVSIRRYANMMGQSLINNNVAGSDGELEITYAALQTNNPKQLEKLKPLTEMYKKLRDDALATPVPERFAADHLNLINVYNALYRDLTDFQLIFDDPMVALLRIKRYQDDATGLATVLNTMYRKSLPFESLFTPEDPAMVFIAFSN